MIASSPKGDKRRRLCNTFAEPAVASSSAQWMRKLGLSVKALSQNEQQSYLDALEKSKRESMEVKVQTTMCLQRFLNAGMMSQEEVSDMQSLAREIASLRNVQQALRVLFINATEHGGGVAEMRPDTIALLRDLNVKAQWLVMDGAERFFNVTVHIHEGIQNPRYAPLEQHEVETFQLTSIVNFVRLEQEYALSDIDVLWIDDPQPLGLAPLIKVLYPNILIVWRCHVHVDAEPSIKAFITDLTSGNLQQERDHLFLDFLKARGHGMNQLTPAVGIQVFHREAFAQDLQIENARLHIMPPCINPLSFKNMELNDALIVSTLVKYGIMPGPRVGRDARVPPYILEVSRFDPYKGPMELITAFRDAALQMPARMQREIRLVLVSSLPGDNPSGVRLARLLQAFVDNIDLEGFPEDQRAGGLHDLRKRIHLLMLDDKAPWERLVERLRTESGFDPDRIEGISREMRELAHLPVTEAVASLEHCGLISHSLATRLVAEPLPSGVVFTPKQKAAMLDVLEMRRAQKQPGGTAVTRRRAEQDAFTGKEINAFEVNALQSGALVTAQFSSKEGFGLTVSESLVKCVPGYEGLMVCTLVGGIRQQAEACDCFKIEYPPAEVAESLAEYRSLPDDPSEAFFKSLAARIAKRSSVKLLTEYIHTGALLPEEERQNRSRASRQAVLDNFSTWVNVHNILRAIVKAAKITCESQQSPMIA